MPPATRSRKKLAPEIIADRRGRLMAMQRHISARRLRRFIGQRLPALVEGPSKDTELVWEARLQGMAPEIDGKVYLSDLEPPTGGRAASSGDMVTVEITASHDYDLVGRVIHVREAVPAMAGPVVAPARTISTGATLRVLA